MLNGRVSFKTSVLLVVKNLILLHLQYKLFFYDRHVCKDASKFSRGRHTKYVTINNDLIGPEFISVRFRPKNIGLGAI